MPTHKSYLGGPNQEVFLDIDDKAMHLQEIQGQRCSSVYRCWGWSSD